MTVQVPIPDFAAARRTMIENQLRPVGVSDPLVLDAMGSVGRKILIAGYHMLKTGRDYKDLGESFLDTIAKDAPEGHAQPVVGGAAHDPIDAGGGTD